ncbi:hypothetical protein [Enterococcus casseliflavus]|uniref:hypothetical protein n=1 Tax=Enterococcus casseliflavus TaxID=37734 RepID=UPI003BEEB865
MSSQSLTKGTEYENKSFTKSEQLFITLTRSIKERRFIMPITNPVSITNLKNLLNSASPETLKRLQSYSVYLNHGLYHRNDKGVREIAETVRNLIHGKNLSLAFSSRLITAYEESLKVIHYKDKTVLLDDILHNIKKWFSSYS